VRYQFFLHYITVVAAVTAIAAVAVSVVEVIDRNKLIMYCNAGCSDQIMCFAGYVHNEFLHCAALLTGRRRDKKSKRHSSQKGYVCHSYTVIALHGFFTRPKLKLQGPRQEKTKTKYRGKIV